MTKISYAHPAVSIHHEAIRGVALAFGQNHIKPFHLATEDDINGTVAMMQSWIDKPTMTPEDGWKAWKQIKIDQGWTYNAVRNNELKHHPSMVESYDQLPAFEKAKDYVSRAVSLAVVGLSV